MPVSALGASSGFASASLSASRSSAGAALSDADQRTVAQLRQRDRTVRAHEAAHVAAAAGLVTRGASFSYQTGPDGQRYAVGGEVGIDVSPGRTPDETISKAERIRAAALAPADPSAQDRQVAASAERMAIEARLEISASETSGNASASGPAASYAAIASASAGSGSRSRVDTYA